LLACSPMRSGLCAALLAALVFPTAATAHTNAGWQLSLEWPATGTITSPFGQDGYRWHSGLDIGMLQSLAINAAAPGVVTEVGYVPSYAGYGSVVAVAHGAGYSTLYAHLSRPLVRRGQSVWQDDRIGIAGCSGWCTGTHLHFELRYQGVPIDPSLLIVS
jgi:murein DD-endopeptidase MepM/ murein hydrolase activator NlpD